MSDYGKGPVEMSLDTTGSENRWITGLPRRLGIHFLPLSE